MKFLVVDDSVTMRRIVVNSLQRIGFADTVEAGDGMEALDKFDSTVRFVITDWNMPNMNGLEFVTNVRADPRLREMTLVMVTTESEQSQIVRALAAGAHEYVIKPFTEGAMIEKLALLGLVPTGAKS